MSNNLNINEFKCALYGTTNCLLSNYTIISNGKDIYNVTLNLMHQDM
jgi:hypothetical protein